MRRFGPLVCLSLLHAIVDACALLVAPLWPGIEQSYGLTFAGLSAAFIVQSLPTNVSQVVFGWLRDRRPMPRWVWIGPVIAVVSLPMMGQAASPVALFLLLTVGGIGVGAFHPEAAVAAGRMLPESRTRAISIFMLGGTLGMSMGPLASGFVVSKYGLHGLAAFVPPLLVSVLVLQRLGGLGRPTAPQPATSAPREPVFAGRIGLAVGLLAICSLRLVPNMAMEKVLSYMLTARGVDVAGIGRMQSLFLASTSIGMVLMAIWFRNGREKPFLIATPLLSIPLLWILSRDNCSEWLFVAALLAHGIILWGTTPAMVSYAQQQFPGGAGFASALTMGLSWGVAGLIQAPITVWYRFHGNPGGALVAFIPFVLVSSLGACLLPPLHRTGSTSSELANPVQATEREPQSSAMAST